MWGKITKSNEIFGHVDVSLIAHPGKARCAAWPSPNSCQSLWLLSSPDGKSHEESNCIFRMSHARRKKVKSKRRKKGRKKKCQCEWIETLEEPNKERRALRRIVASGHTSTLLHRVTHGCSAHVCHDRRARNKQKLTEHVAKGPTFTISVEQLTLATKPS